MKHSRILALVLAVAMTVGVLSAGVLAADTDGTSQATQKAESESAAKEKPQSRPQSDSAGDSGTSAGAHGRKGCKKEQTAEPEGAIGKDRAKEIALADAQISADQAGKVRSRVTESDGTVIYKVRFTCDGQRYSYRIDALSGEILDKKTAAAEDTRTKGGRSRSRSDASDTQASAV